jgi:hypothetical protein
LYRYTAVVDSKVDGDGTNPRLLEKCHQTMEASVAMAELFDAFIEKNLPPHCFVDARESKE